MKIALVDPTYRLSGELVKLRSVGYPPLTLPALAAALPPGHEVRLFHEKCEEVPLEEPFDLVFFTTMGPNLIRAAELSAAFRASGARTVIGGWTAMAYADRFQDDFDTIVFGEAEGVLERIVEDAAAGRLEASYEDYLPDLSQLRTPRYDLVEPRLWGPITPIESSRGCANGCSFCAVTRYTMRRRRTIPAERVLESIETARRHFGHSTFYFTDPNFGVHREHALDLMERLVPLGIRWLASVDVRTLEDDEFLDLARKSGCFTLQVGFESLVPEKLDASSKGFAVPDRYPEMIARCHRRGIPLTALMMVGFDEDTPESFQAILSFLERNRIPLLVLHVMTPVRGTPLWDRVVAEGRLLEDPLEGGDGIHLFVQPKRMTVEDFEREFWHLVDAAFSLPSMIRRTFHRDFLRNPIAWILLFLTALLRTRPALRRRWPPGMYE